MFEANVLSEQAGYLVFQNIRQLLYSKIPSLVESVIKCTALQIVVFTVKYTCAPEIL